MTNNSDGIFTVGDAVETPATPGKLQGTAQDCALGIQAAHEAPRTAQAAQSATGHVKSVATIEKENSVGESLVPVGAPDNPQVGVGPATLRQQRAPAAPVDPFDPMNLGISTDYAAAINAKASTKPFELRAPNEQEYFRTSPQENHHLVVGSIADKQDMGKVYIVSGVLLDEVKLKFPKVVRAVELVLTQILAGASLVWPVPLAEDRGGKWNSTQRAACLQGKTRWTNKTSGRGEYDIVTVDNPKKVDWDSFPPFRDILRQAASERLIDSLEHPLLKKLRGEIE